MKRHGNLWEKITSLENIKAAHIAARRGKSYYTEVQMVNKDLEQYAKEIQLSLLNKTFTTSPYVVSMRSDGRKIRTIHKLPYYPDRIVQHALLNVVGPIFTRCFIRDSFQSIVGRGTYDAMKRVKKIISEKKPKYALKIDIEKYYPSVNNDKLKNAVRQKIKCEDTLWLIDNIIDSAKGLPIGNYTSQHLGNLYLNKFDWWIKQQIKPAGYFRYCDDIVVMNNSRYELVQLCKKMISRLETLKLKTKPNWSIYNLLHQGLNFVGYIFFQGKTKLRPSIAKQFKETCKEIKTFSDRNRSRIMSYKGWCRPVNAKLLWRNNIKKLFYLFPKQLRYGI